MNRRYTAGSEDFLLELLASAVNQRETLFRQQKISWGWLYKISDYHHVSNLIYYKIMWEDGKDAQKWKEKFEQRYRLSIKLQAGYSRCEQTLRKYFEQRKVHVTFLGASLYTPYYPYPEMRMPQPLRILIEKGKSAEACEIMKKAGFRQEEQQENEKTLRFSFTMDIKAEVMEKLPFSDRCAKAWFDNFSFRLPCEEGKKYIHEMDLEILYIYLITDISQKYAEGEAELRDALDLWVFLKEMGDEMEWKWIRKEIKALRRAEFSEYFLHLAGTWFGKMQFPEERNTLSVMQAYLLSKGQNARRENEELFPVIKNVADNYYRNLKKEEKRKQRQLKYPPLEYMKTVFPMVGRLPWLLPVFWIIRLLKVKEYALKERAKERKSEKEEE